MQEVVQGANDTSLLQVDNVAVAFYVKVCEMKRPKDDEDSQYEKLIDFFLPIL